MSEPRRNDAGTRPLSRDRPGPYPGPGTRYDPVPADHGGQLSAEHAPRWGALPSRRGIVLVISGAVIGTVVTVLAGGEPGFVLGFFLVIATLAASLAVEPRATYRIIPAPALAYLAGAVLAGLIHDRAADTSRAALAISAAQWVARGFVAMTIATVLVVLVGAVRWLRLWHRYGAVSSPSAFGARTAAGLRSAGSPRSTGGQRSVASRPSGGSSRSAGTRSSAGGPSGASGRRGPAEPRTSASGGDRRQNAPPGPER
jgi:hypothetical protein